MRMQANEVLLSRLQAKGLDFVVVGGVCCVYHGVPMATFDLDICCEFNEENVRRIQAAVSDLHPFHRLTPQKLPLDLTEHQIATAKNLYLQTDLGRLDCLSAISGVGSFADVLKHSEWGEIDGGRFRFLNLEGIIMAKEAMNRDRDIGHLRFLKPLRERQKSKNQ